MSTGLVLSGGSIKGSFQAGAIAACLDHGVRPSVFHGISVGSLNGAFLADRAGRRVKNGRFDPAAWPEIGTELLRFWRDRVTGPEALVRRRPVIGTALDVLTAHFDGLLDTGPLQALVRSEVSLPNLRAAHAAGVRFVTGAASLQAGTIEYKDATDDRVLDYVIASAAIPFLMAPVHLDVQRVYPKPGDPTGQVVRKRRETYVDGGVRDILPLKPAIDAGAETIYCISCETGRLDESFDGFNPRNLVAFAGRIFGIMTHETIRNDLDHALDVNTFVRALREHAPDAPVPGGKRLLDLHLIAPAQRVRLDIEHFTGADLARYVDVGYAIGKDLVGSGRSRLRTTADLGRLHPPTVRWPDDDGPGHAVA